MGIQTRKKRIDSLKINSFAQASVAADYQQRIMGSCRRMPCVWDMPTCMCIDMRIDMRIDMCIYMSIDMSSITPASCVCVRMHSCVLARMLRSCVRACVRAFPSTAMRTPMLCRMLPWAHPQDFLDIDEGMLHSVLYLAVV